MIRMTVSVYDVSDWLFGAGVNGREQPSSLSNTASRINHRNRIGSNDETNIGDSPFIFARHKFRKAHVSEKPRCDFADWQRAFLCLREC